MYTSCLIIEVISEGKRLGLTTFRIIFNAAYTVKWHYLTLQASESAFFIESLLRPHEWKCTALLFMIFKEWEMLANFLKLFAKLSTTCCTCFTYSGTGNSWMGLIYWDCPIGYLKWFTIKSHFTTDWLTIITNYLTFAGPS